jgi:DNA invertase Pin-like site-specific DNA recombinase
VSATPIIRAAQYVRMSTEHQQYSTENQSDILREYAAKRGMEIVRTFADAGKSGLRLEGRDAIKELIAIVQNGTADFTAILVYDVSRWGRFQDADESAYYEYICKRAGISVCYCAEQFENDGSPVSTIVKSVKRTMAGEYSRELSAKVFKGQCKLIELGFRQGGPAGYGLRRLLVDHTGVTKAVLGRGEQKSIQTDRVVLAPGPTEERAVVGRIYRAFIEERRSEAQIAELLNATGVAGEHGAGWSRASVHQVLTNEKYIGHNVYNRVSFKLKKARVRNPPEMWVRRDGAFDPIVEAKDFYLAQGIILERHRRLSDDEMLERLRRLLERAGKLSGPLIDEDGGMPSSAAYRHRFGSLLAAYAHVEYSPPSDYGFLELRRRLGALHPTIVDGVVRAMKQLGGHVEVDEAAGVLRLNGQLSVSIVLSRYETTEAGAPRWRVSTASEPDLTIAVRMDGANEAPLDYYLLPTLDVGAGRLRFREDNGAELDTFRFDTLDYLCGMAEQVRIEVAA